MEKVLTVNELQRIARKHGIHIDDGFLKERNYEIHAEDLVEYLASKGYSREQVFKFMLDLVNDEDLVALCMQAYKEGKVEEKKEIDIEALRRCLSE